MTKNYSKGNIKQLFVSYNGIYSRIIKCTGHLINKRKDYSYTLLAKTKIFIIAQLCVSFHDNKIYKLFFQNQLIILIYANPSIFLCI